MFNFDVLSEDFKKYNASVYPYSVEISLGATLCFGKNNSGPFAVYIDTFALSSLDEIAYVAAHECGHCATGALHKVGKYELVGKNEEKANRWLINRFIPFDELNDAIVNKEMKPWELAEYFSLPEAAIDMAINYYINVKGFRFGH